MTVKQLKKLLDKIPASGVINLARRREIIALILAKTGGAG
jgi:hypothetical protein